MQKGKVVILGGTPRSGKTTLAVMLAKNGFSKISFDHIGEAIDKGLPEVVIKDRHNQECSAAKLYGFFETLVECAVADAGRYGLNTVIDMYDFTPEFVRRLPCQDSIEVYFLGYPGFNAGEILHNIRHYADPADWIAQVDEDYAMEVAERCHRVNQKLLQQCRQYGYEFIDTGAGDNRAVALDGLFHRITTG
jgi:2-phosphoglycerate kinase